MSKGKQIQMKPTQNDGKSGTPKKQPPVLRDQSETEGRIGEGKNAGVRNTPGGTAAQCSKCQAVFPSHGKHFYRQLGKMIYLPLGKHFYLADGKQFFPGTVSAFPYSAA